MPPSLSPDKRAKLEAIRQAENDKALLQNKARILPLLWPMARPALARLRSATRLARAPAAAAHACATQQHTSWPHARRGRVAARR
jgi:hypothetical protein